jgi:hypothetical protein
MLPADLKPEQFAGYPPEAGKVALDNLSTLQRLPLPFLPSLLREIIDYDVKFPAERKALDRELAYLRSLSSEEFQTRFQAFARIQLSSDLEKSDWINSPAQFIEQLSAHLWTTHQMDAFRKAALDYGDHLHAALPLDPFGSPRLVVVAIGQGAEKSTEPLFRNLRPRGAYYSNVDPNGGLDHLLNAVTSRARSDPAPYAHWYIDGGQELVHAQQITSVSYKTLEPVRATLLAKMQTETKKSGMGPEALRTVMAQMRPSDLGFDKAGDPILDQFQARLLTEGSGTQIFSTSFTQWAAREALRRAEPLTLFLRFAPRQKQKPMNELLSPNRTAPELDPAGSLVDADMGAYYTWLNLQRLSGSAQSLFLAWFEDHNEAVAISPVLPRGTVSAAPASIPQILSWMT